MTFNRRQPACAKNLSTLFTLHEDAATQSNDDESEALHASLKKDHVMQEKARFRRWEELQELERLLKENAILRQKIFFYKKVWYGLMDILYEVYNAKVSAQRALEAFKEKKAAAEQAWLAYWDLQKKETSGLEFKQV